MPGEILIIDDDALIRTVVADNLADADFIVHTASTEAEGFARLSANPEIRAALVDYCLPRPVGIDLCRRLAAAHPDVAVALYTGYGELAAIRKGDDDLPILSKSLRHDELVVAINALLDGRKPVVADGALASRVEILWEREARRETAQAVGRAMHSHFDPTLSESVPSTLAQTMLRLGGLRR